MANSGSTLTDLIKATRPLEQCVTRILNISTMRKAGTSSLAVPVPMLDPSGRLVALSGVSRTSATDLLRIVRSVLSTVGQVESAQLRERIYTSALHSIIIFKDLLEALIVVCCYAHFTTLLLESILTLSIICIRVSHN